jgi:hypothetical protein
MQVFAGDRVKISIDCEVVLCGVGLKKIGLMCSLLAAQVGSSASTVVSWGGHKRWSMI